MSRRRGIALVIKELIVRSTFKEGRYIGCSFIQSNTRATIFNITITIIAFNIQTSLPTLILTRFRRTFITWFRRTLITRFIMSIVSTTSEIAGGERIVLGSGSVDVGRVELCLRLRKSSCQANEGCETEDDGGAHIEVANASEVMEEKWEEEGGSYAFSRGSD